MVWRCQPCQLRTSYSSSPVCCLACKTHSPTAQQQPAISTSFSRVRRLERRSDCTPVHGHPFGGFGQALAHNQVTLLDNTIGSFVEHAGRHQSLSPKCSLAYYVRSSRTSSVSHFERAIKCWSASLRQTPFSFMTPANCQPFCVRRD